MTDTTSERSLTAGRPPWRLAASSLLRADGIVQEGGFADPERMRRAFLRAFGQPPQFLRRNARLTTD